MAAKRRFDVTTPRPKYNEDGVWWLKIGRAFENDKGQIMIFLDAYPVPDAEGAVKLALFEPRDNSYIPPEPTPKSKKAKPGKPQSDDDMGGDEIPF